MQNHKYLRPYVIFLFFFTIYIVTISHHPNWGDSAKLIIFTNNLKFSSDSGYHNLLLIIFYPFTKLPLNNLALKVNIANMTFSILTLYLLAILLLKVGNSIKTSIFLVLCLGLSHLFWHLSVITESYILTSFFLILYLLLVEEYKKNPTILKLSLAFSVAGLGIQVNLIFAGIFFITILFYIKPILSLKTKIFVPILIFTLSLLPIIVIIAIEIQTGSSLFEAVIENFLQQKYKKSMNLYAIFDTARILKIVALFFYQFPFLFLFTFISFINSSKKLISFSMPNFITHLSFYILFVFSVTMTIIYTMPKSIYFLTFASMFFILSLSRIIDNILVSASQKSYTLLIVLLLITNILTYLIAPYLTRNTHISNEVPFRNSARYFLTPWKHNEHSSYDFFKYCQQNLDQKSVLISDFTVLKTLEYYKLTGEKILYETWDVEKKDILQKIKDNISKKIIYFTGGSMDYEILHKNFYIEKAGKLYKINLKP